MTRFVYVLPAGRFRWEVRVDDAKIVEAAAVHLFTLDRDRKGRGLVDWKYASDYERTYFTAEASAVIAAAFPQITAEPQFYRLKRDALIAARAIAVVIGGEVQPHNRWGRIQDPDSYGNDPRESKG